LPSKQQVGGSSPSGQAIYNTYMNTIYLCLYVNTDHKHMLFATTTTNKSAVDGYNEGTRVLICNPIELDMNKVWEYAHKALADSGRL
jgi:hypothetical protein